MTPAVVVDTREQKPYRFPGISDVVREKLDVGDYTYDGYQHTFAVERKSFDDFARSVGADRLRFENEIRRANGFAHRNEDGNPRPGTKPDYQLDDFAVVVEGKREALHRYAQQVKRESGKDAVYQGDGPYYSAMHPNSILATVDSWENKYKNLSFIWGGSKENSKQETLAYLDQQYLKHSTG